MTLKELEAHAFELMHDVHDQLKLHVYQRSEEGFAAGDAARDAVVTREQLEERQRAARAALLAGMGGLPSSDTPLSPEIVGVIEAHGFRIEKVIYQARPGHYVTANLYLPNDITEPRGSVLFLCGHHHEAKHSHEYQQVCQYLVQAGLVVLAQDPVGQGERFSYYEPSLGGTTVGWGTSEHEYAGLQCWPLGDGIARYFLHDAMRGIDYLSSRPEVDPARIGVTGNSGGGTQTSLMMLADPRIAAAAPTTFIMNRQTYMWAGGAQDAEQIWPGFSAAGFDHEDIVLAMAPRPVRVQAVTSDFFPIEGTSITVERCGRFWELCGSESKLDLVEDNSVHLYTVKLARAAAEFFARHLLGKEVVLEDSKIALLDPALLWCTQSGQVRGEIEGAVFVHDANQKQAQALSTARSKKDADERLKEAKHWLSQRVRRHRKPCDLNPRYYDKAQFGDLTVEMAYWFSQPRLVNTGFVFRNFERAGQNLPVTLAIWDGGTRTLQPHLPVIRAACAAGRALLVLNVTGAGGLTASSLRGSPAEGFYEIVHKMGDDLFWLGDSLAALRTYDVLRAVDLIQVWPGLSTADTLVYAHGKHGIYGRFAAAIDERIAGVEVAAGLPSYTEWVSDRHYDSWDMKSVVLHGMLQHFDLADLEGMAKL